MEQELHTIKRTDETDDILLAALKLFAEQGYFNTSLTDIAKAAGLTTVSSIYQSFNNKQAIAIKLNDMIFDSLNVSIDDIRRRNQKASEQLRSFVNLLFKLTDEAPNIMRFLLVMQTSEFIPQQKPLLETPAFTKVVKIMQAGIRAGEIRNIDPLLATGFFLGVINNTLRMVLSGELEKNADAYQPQAWLAAWNLIAKKSTCF
ncbi:TetR/AcrR family transcriptional regulator [Methylocucumis oryzae]|uniref:TetR family transcriptional regulator n=1 Tax=Methylocucumis oryzae TaxID=1632867 RepID=A0A0F3II28_9GAMM|nr:TetR/AcrR family transcriptional regulator [Methylocucumis oryzae]KJV06322.1 TetR family transcriptional regulator [Methylocucumis oryzae]